MPNKSVQGICFCAYLGRSSEIYEARIKPILVVNRGSVSVEIEDITGHSKFLTISSL